jgi:polyhydroxyalkanoate synthesis regulator phasin
MLLVLLLNAAVEPGNNGLDIPPASDPTGRVIALLVASLAVVGPYATAKVTAKRGASNGPTPLPVSDAATNRLDLNADYLKKYVAGIELEVEELKKENSAQRQQIIALIEDRATFRAQNEALRADIAELRTEVSELRGQLRGHR